MREIVIAFVAGVIFAVGLVFGGMTHPEKVIGFLDVSRVWDPSLAFVMGGAVVVHAVGVFITRRMRYPRWAPRFHFPTRKDLDWRLVLGAAVFGIGWGYGGYCPGPAVVSLAAGAEAPLLLIGGMWVGLQIAGKLSDRLDRERAGDAPTDTDFEIRGELGSDAPRATVDG